MHIIATIGPKSISRWVIKEFIENGVDILRLNCSHFDQKNFEEIIKYAKGIKKDIKIMVDLCGKKIRISNEFQYIFTIYNGQEVQFCGEDFYKSLDLEDIKQKFIIPLNIDAERLKKSNIKSFSMKDNTMKFEIITVKEGIIKTKVLKGGVIRAGKGCNIFEVYNNKGLSRVDKEHINWAMKNNVDIICQSFVEDRNSIKIIKDFIKESNFKVDIWAKVETPIGVKNIEEILEETNNIVIGRGDLIPESNIFKCIELEYGAIDKIKRNNKKVIIATHLLNSMKDGFSITLPELESIYNFIKIKVDGFLLAGETSIGKAPIKTIKMLKSSIDYYGNSNNE